MEHFGSFVTLAAIPYFIGFLALCFWWRWWLLVPAGLVAAVLAKVEFASVNASDGAGAAFGIILVIFAMIGAASGFVASGVVVIGRMTRLRALRAVYVLPVVFILGFGSFFAVTWTQQKIRETRYAPPSAACLDNLHPARIADVAIRFQSHLVSCSTAMERVTVITFSGATHMHAPSATRQTEAARP
ncbi:hypothetical protein [Rhizobium ruizarguesonis]|uniref:hypothetical protein n=1 Tax=Rhizobium ruizarguesonis TaxID=2081791 RepID=UPI001FE1F001|nr:hypothetical protein [Rhizobium ruizarguesonis]